MQLEKLTITVLPLLIAYDDKLYMSPEKKPAVRLCNLGSIVSKNVLL